MQVVERAFHKVNVREHLDFWHPIGVIAECGSSAEELNEAAFGKMPVVYFDADKAKRGPGFYVGSDSASIGHLAAQHLLALGLPNYAFVAFRLPLFWSNDRRRHFVKEVTRAGKPCIVFDMEHKQRAHVRQAALARWLGSLPRPCGIFAANDYVGEEILNTCAQLGISVPEEIAVLGVDNDENLCEVVSPTLSSIEPDFIRGGYIAAELLDRIISGEVKRPQTISFSASRIVVRQSSRRIACDRKKVAAALELIRRRACSGLSAADVVAAIGEPRRTAEMHFREVVGKSIHEEIDDVRFAKVVQLLGNPFQYLDAVHSMCGFATSVAMRKAFRLRMGCSMREWRKQHLNHGRI